MLSIAAVVSLAFALAVVTMWPRSYLRWDSCFFVLGTRMGRIEIADGVAVVVIYDFVDPRSHWRWSSTRADRNFGNWALALYDSPEHRRLPGFSWGPEGGPGGAGHFFAFPLALLILPALPLPLIWRAMRGRWKADRRRRLGQCAACGYSLAGNSSGVCPECGKAILTTETPGTQRNANAEIATDEEDEHR